MAVHAQAHASVREARRLHKWFQTTAGRTSLRLCGNPALTAPAFRHWPCISRPRTREPLWIDPSRADSIWTWLISRSSPFALHSMIQCFHRRRSKRWAGPTRWAWVALGRRFWRAASGTCRPAYGNSWLAARRGGRGARSSHDIAGQTALESSRFRPRTVRAVPTVGGWRMAFSPVPIPMARSSHSFDKGRIGCKFVTAHWAHLVSRPRGCDSSWRISPVRRRVGE